MTRRAKNIARAILFFIALMCLLFGMSYLWTSCKTVKKTIEKTKIDSLTNTSKTDSSTTRIIREYIRDTIKVRDSVKLQTIMQGYSQAEILAILKMMREGRDTSMRLGNVKDGPTIHIHDGRLDLSSQQLERYRTEFESRYTKLIDSLQKRIEKQESSLRATSTTEKQETKTTFFGTFWWYLIIAIVAGVIGFSLRLWIKQNGST